MKGLTLSEAITAFRAEMRRQNWTANGQERYGRELDRFAAFVGPDTSLEQVSKVECRAWLDSFDNHAASTVALEHTILSSFFRALVLDEVIETNPMEKIRRPKVPALRDRVRTRITSEQVNEMLAACENWTERMALHVLAYTGARRHAVSEVRWRDVDGKRWTIRFAEKGRKTIVKPIADELRVVMTQYALERSAAGDPIDPDEWVVPSMRRRTEWLTRSDRTIYVAVKDVAARCGIKAHVHAFRAAFAVHFLRTNPAQLEALRQLMGHASVSTTQGYLDELEGAAAMRVVESLSFTQEAAA